MRKSTVCSKLFVDRADVFLNLFWPMDLSDFVTWCPWPWDDNWLPNMLCEPIIIQAPLVDAHAMFWHKAISGLRIIRISAESKTCYENYVFADEVYVTMRKVGTCLALQSIFGPNHLVNLWICGRNAPRKSVELKVNSYTIDVLIGMDCVYERCIL